MKKSFYLTLHRIIESFRPNNFPRAKSATPQPIHTYICCGLWRSGELFDSSRPKRLTLVELSVWGIPTMAKRKEPKVRQKRGPPPTTRGPPCTAPAPTVPFDPSHRILLVGEGEPLLIPPIHLSIPC